ncbi:hypothetical protein LY78DRAFT_443126 [Colletotrichum sublineola]|nr:hypothetical protein LY78DRAFT_443126 [Colletotrichum sublineola]
MKRLLAIHAHCSLSRCRPCTSQRCGIQLMIGPCIASFETVGSCNEQRKGKAKVKQAITNWGKRRPTTCYGATLIW